MSRTDAKCRGCGASVPGVDEDEPAVFCAPCHKRIRPLTNPPSLASELRAMAEAIDGDERYLFPSRAAAIDLLSRAATELDRAGGWVRCSERLPEHGTRALCWDGDSVTEMMLSNGAWYWEHELVRSVTHWQPLPPAPEPDRTEGAT